MKPFLLGVLLIHVCCWPAVLHAGEPQNIPVERLGSEYRLIGKLHMPLGNVFQVEGVVVEGPSKGYNDGPNLRAQRIQGQATQPVIQIKLAPYSPARSLPKIEVGKTYQMEAYETGYYIGIPSEALKSGPSIQTCGHFFHTVLVYYKAKVIEPIHFAPAEFQGRHGLIEGIARTRDHQSVMEGNGWTVIVAPKTAWPKHVEGKLIETYGMYNPDANLYNPDVKQKQFTLVDGTWGLVRLEDQVGHTVALRGRALEFNNMWWFRCRGTDLYVENINGLPGWTSANYGLPIVIHGTLDKAKLPRLDQISLKSDRDLKEYYIVRKASWEPLSDGPVMEDQDAED